MGIQRGGRVQCDLSPPYSVHGCKKSYIRAIDVGSFLIELSVAENTGTMNQERSAPMKRRQIICTALLGLCGALAGMALLLYDYARADVLAGPLSAPHLPRDIIQLTPVEKLGKLI